MRSPAWLMRPTLGRAAVPRRSRAARRSPQPRGRAHAAQVAGRRSQVAGRRSQVAGRRSQEEGPLQEVVDTPGPRHRSARPFERDETPSEELARLLDEARGRRALAFDDLRRIARLYRSQSARLARLRDRGDDLDRIAHLNALCLRAHGLLYSSAAGRTASGRPSSQDGFRRRFVVEAWGRTRPLRHLAWSILALGAFLGFCLVRLDPAALYALLPATLGYDAGQIDALARSEEARALFFEREAGSLPANAVFGSYLFAHNTRVGLLAFAAGVLGGLPTLLLQLYNGILLGAIAALFLQGDQTLSFLAWILPHGVPELTAITLCCAGGLVLGRSVVLPGRRTRSEALRRSARDALALVLASLPLFFAAAWIESFVRESTIGTGPRLALAAGGAALLLGIGFGLRARPESPQATPPDWIDGLLDAPDSSDSRRPQPAP